MTTRRTFLKLAAAAGTALGLVRYAEPLQDIPDEYRDWIEDRGDFYIVRVPTGKIFANEELLKPTIFFMGARSVVKNTRIEGFVNIQAPYSSLFHGNEIDASKVTVGRNRPVVEIGETTDFTMSCCNLRSSTGGQGLKFGPGSFTLKGSGPTTQLLTRKIV